MDAIQKRKITLSKGNIDINVDKIKRKFNIVITGQFCNETVTEFMEKYNQNMANISPSSFDLIIDCRLLGVIQSHLIDGLKETYKSYDTFKNVTFINPEHIIGKKQLMRIAKEGNYERFNFVDTL